MFLVRLVAGCPECCGWRRRSLDQRVTILMPLISWTGITLSDICVELLYPNQPEQAAAWVDQDSAMLYEGQAKQRQFGFTRA